MGSPGAGGWVGVKPTDLRAASQHTPLAGHLSPWLQHSVDSKDIHFVMAREQVDGRGTMND